MLSNFNDSVRQTLQGHNIEDEKLESALSDLFNQFERRVLSREFIEEIAKHQDREKDRIERFR